MTLKGMKAVVGARDDAGPSISPSTSAVLPGFFFHSTTVSRFIENPVSSSGMKKNA